MCARWNGRLARRRPSDTLVASALFFTLALLLDSHMPFLRAHPMALLFCGAMYVGLYGPAWVEIRALIVGAGMVAALVLPHAPGFWVEWSMYQISCVILATVSRSRFLVTIAAGKARRDGEVQSARQRSILDDALDAIVTTDGQIRVLTCNHAAEALFGYPLTELVGNLTTAFIPVSFPQAYASMVADMARVKDALGG